MPRTCRCRRRSAASASTSPCARPTRWPGRSSSTTRATTCSVAPTLQVEYVLEPGEPLGVLEREALGASMVVVGSDHVPWFERLLRSRVAGTLALHSPCPVVVVPE
ncbi:MAG: universal stress protein, partial [Actinomycetales bacterium]